MAEGAVRSPVRRQLFRSMARGLIRPALHPRVSVTAQRRWIAMLTGTVPPPRGIQRYSVRMGGVPAEHLDYRDGGDMALLFLHGGGYVFGSPRTHRSISGTLAREAGATVFAPDYRLAPEYPCPAAVEDVMAAYRWLLDTGWPPARIAVAGDSAGGGLALAAMVALRDEGAALPAALGLISPWVDLTLAGDSMRERAAADPMLRQAWLAQAARLYAGPRGVEDSFCSPLFADLGWLPPLFVQVGSDEILYSDAERLAERARLAGGEAALRVFEGLWHDFHLHAGLLPEADAALAELAGQLRTACQSAV